MPLVTFTGTLGRKRASHLLRRACFGGSKSEIDEFSQLTPADALNLLIDNDLPDPTLPIDPLTGQDWINNEIQSENFDILSYLLRWKLGNLLGNGIEEEKKLAFIFRERITYFLHTHFTTKKSVVNNGRSLYYQQALFRLFAFDSDDFEIPNEEDPELEPEIVPKNFKELTKKISIDNAMLKFLDGRFNLKGSPNENYARELLELYSVGKGLEGFIPNAEFDGDYFYFTEEDIVSGAEVLSGFNVDTSFETLDEVTGLPRGKARGNSVASQHTEGVKSFSSRMRNAQVVPNEALLLNGNPTEESVIDEISQLIELIYEDREASIHTCRRLYRFFVYHDVSQEIQDDIIESMADIFIANNYKILPVITSLLTSTHFYGEDDASYSDDNFGSLIKSPLDLVLGFYRNFEISLPDYVLDLERYHDQSGALLSNMSSQGMDFYEPFEVAGYYAYFQYPGFNRNWITTNYLTARYDFINDHISDITDENSSKVDIVSFVRNNFADVASDARQLILSVSSYFLAVGDNLSFEETQESELTPQRLNYFLEAFLFNPQIDDDPEASWTFRWENNVDPETVANQLVNLFNAILQTPEYQLM